MLKKKTCLLLGAGASQHLGFPLGCELRQLMLTRLFDAKGKPAGLGEGLTRGNEDLSLFYDRLAYGNWSSPDAFLEKHREFIQTGKHLIGNILSEFEDVRRITLQGGWYDRLVSEIHVDDPCKLKDNGLSVVTFNYDRSLDFRLHKYIENQFGIEASEAWSLLEDAIKIVHVHGSLGRYPQSTYADKSNIYDWGQDIKIISEVEDDTEEFRLASDLLNNADRVVVLGFGFAADNVKRLKYFKQTVEEERDIAIAVGHMRGTAHELATQEWLSQWGLKPRQHFFPYTANQVVDFVPGLFI
ncbi:MAG: hypothetical protein ACK5TX_20315 [Planctomyces sp.]|jgi:hypothetical protein